MGDPSECRSSVPVDGRSVDLSFFAESASTTKFVQNVHAKLFGPNRHEWKRLPPERATLNTPTTFADLMTFILDQNQMRVTHIYKPVLLQAILGRGGTATKNEIAGEIMSRDELQVEHYRRNIVQQMPGRRLVRDGVMERDGNSIGLTPHLWVRVAEAGTTCDLPAAD